MNLIPRWLHDIIFSISIDRGRESRSKISSISTFAGTEFEFLFVYYEVLRALSLLHTQLPLIHFPPDPFANRKSKQTVDNEISPLPLPLPGNIISYSLNNTYTNLMLIETS